MPQIKDRQLTTADRIVALLKDGHECSGARIAAELETGSWDLYPALYNLERNGVLTSRWEDAPKPRRRLYKMTA